MSYLGHSFVEEVQLVYSTATPTADLANEKYYLLESYMCQIGLYSKYLY